MGFGTSKSDVLYLDLEDGDAELKERIKKLCGNQDVPDGLLYLTEVPTMNDGLVDLLEQILQERPSVKLLVLDTLGMVLGAQSKDSNQFAQDYEMFGSLKRLANRHSIALLVIHHTRKTIDERNPFNQIYGSVAIQGVLDTMMVLSKESHRANQARLYVTGRRCRQQEYALSFDTDNCSWSLIGDAAMIDEEFRRGQYEKSEIVSAIKQAIALGNGTWKGSMTELSHVAENSREIGHGLGEPRAMANCIKRIEKDLYRYDGITYSVISNGTGGRKYTFTRTAFGGEEGDA